MPIYGWWMLLSTTFGQSPFEVQALYRNGSARLWLLFLPAAYVQGDSLCYAEYHIEVLIRDGVRVYGHYHRRVYLYASSVELPQSNNLFSWNLSGLPFPLQWEVVVWDAARQSAVSRSGIFSSDQWAVLFSQNGRGYDRASLSASMEVVYHLPNDTYIGQAALYKEEAALPELRQYLSIEERRFTFQARNAWDTFHLYWRVEDLPPGAYLIGLYLYKGEELAYQAFYSVRRK
ncbi:MAG: hypothetical protein NZZ60_07715 [Bacteroidia bacterium]|nr:hypothetical protein [Bacteroidia bacterium]